MINLKAIFLLALGFAPAVIAQKPYAVTGVPVDANAASVPMRKNINELYSTSGPQWDLYIRALAEMQEVESSDPLSYFQMMGIHGRPYIEWNGGGEKKSDAWQGYCPHGEKIFVSWHRPFVLLYEQELVKRAKILAQDYPQRYRYNYIRAAEELRSPFWDWGTDSIPEATVPAKIKVNVPNGGALKEIEITNPLSTYKFPKEALDGKYGQFDSSNRERIYHCPAPNSYPDSANDNLASRPYKRWVYDAFSKAKSFADFASTGDSGISLEQIHNGIHWDAACGGQFLSSDFSAFDPLFMLHHTNVDRLWAYWQAMSPNNSIFEDSYQGGARYSTPQNTIITADSPLNPFFGADGKFHTTRTVEKLKGFGYSYEGLEYWNMTPEQMQQESKRLINQWYGPGGQKSSIQSTESGQKAPESRKFFATLEFDVTEIERPAVIDLHVGEDKVGEFVVMELPREGILHGAFPLDDDAIEASGASKSEKSTDAIIKSLQSSLKVTITKKNGDNYPLSSAPSLKVGVGSVVATKAGGEDEMPDFSSQTKPKMVPAEDLAQSS